MQRRLLRFLVVLAIVAGVLFAAVRLSSRVSVRDLVSVESLSDEALPELLQRIRKFHRVVTRGGAKLVEVSASEATYYRNSNAIEIVAPRVVFFDRGEAVGQISGETGTLVIDEGDVVSVALTGGVRLAFVDIEILADRISYDRREKRVVATGKTTLRSDEFEVSGIDLTVDLDRSRLVIERDVRMVVFRSGRRRPPMGRPS